MPYIFTHSDLQERERLSAIEATADPFTIERMETMGVRPGWQCLEIGAGGGSMTQWLCKRVGPEGRVVATDLQTKFLDQIDHPNLEVIQHDITKQDIDFGQFDLIYSRKVLEHMSDPLTPLKRMYDALRDGGFLYVEDTDMGALMMVSESHREVFEKGYKAFLEGMGASGFQPTFGRTLGDQLRVLGLKHIRVKGTTNEWSGANGLPAGKIFKMTFERMKDTLVTLGLLTKAEADAYLDAIQAPDFYAMTSVHFTSFGQKAGT
jgi:SAM-dependent methyltransferase